MARRKAAAPYLFLAFLVVLFLGDLLVTGRSFALRDMFTNFLPWRTYARQSLAAGEIPWWNPYGAYGKPFVADTETGFFYPPNLLLAFLPVMAAMKLNWMLHLWIAGASLFALCRAWGLRVASCLVAAVSFMFGTFPIALIESQHGLATIVWTPLVLLLLHRLAQAWVPGGMEDPASRPLLCGARPATGLSLVLAVQFLAGHVEFFLYSSLFCGIVFACQCVRDLRGARLAGAALTALLAAALATLLVLPQLLPTLELLPLSDRAVFHDPLMNAGSVSPRHLLALVFPFLFGKVGYYGKYWADSVREFTVGTCYVGLLPLLLLPFSLLLLRAREGRRAPVAVLWALGAAGIVIAMGKYTPVARALYGIPIFSHFRWPSKFHYWVWIVLPLLAGLGFEALDREPAGPDERTRRRALFWLAAAAWLAAALAHHRILAASEAASRLSGNGGLTRAQGADLRGHYQETMLFLAAGLALIGARLAGRIRPAAWGSIAVGCTFLNLAYFGRQVHPVLPDSIYTDSPGPGIVAALRSEGSRVHTFVNRGSASDLLYGETRPEVYRWAKAAGVEDCWLPYGIPSTYSGGFKIVRTAVIWHTLDTVPVGPRLALSRLANVHWWVAEQTGPGDSVSLERIGTKSLSNNLPRAFLVPDWRVAEGTVGEVASRLIASGGFEQTAAIEVNPGGAPLPPPPVPESRASRQPPARVTAFVPGRNRVHVEAYSPGTSLLVLDDTWYPGWEAFVDGRPEPIYRANAWFRGVFLGDGAHSVDFVYKPTHLGLALVASAAGAVLLGLLWALGGASRRRMNTAPLVGGPVQNGCFPARDAQASPACSRGSC